ncbi:hypothetical protein CCB80_07720 [Armatimonadetes bacterium Uphvl-Ar1]|nr:hypothetical protein CCB80_07720 [Armatimonadetes bacterium Uphvl-Ar1]
MGRVGPLSSKEIELILTSKGFSLARQKGSHRVFRNNNGNIVVVPQSKSIPPGTIASIIRQSNLPRSLFESPQP